MFRLEKNKYLETKTTLEIIKLFDKGAIDYNYTPKTENFIDFDKSKML